MRNLNRKIIWISAALDDKRSKYRKMAPAGAGAKDIVGNELPMLFPEDTIFFTEMRSSQQYPKYRKRQESTEKGYYIDQSEMIEDIKYDGALSSHCEAT